MAWGGAFRELAGPKEYPIKIQIGLLEDDTHGVSIDISYLD
jgi:hypothetical protein